jgi:hypothetical protein
MSNDIIRLYKLSQKLKNSENDRDFIRKQLVMNSKCLKDKPKFKQFFDVIRPDVSYELLPLDMKMERRLESCAKKSQQKKAEKEELFVNTNKIGHLCTKRSKRCDYIKRARLALEKLSEKLSKA